MRITNESIVKTGQFQAGRKSITIAKLSHTIVEKRITMSEHRRQNYTSYIHSELAKAGKGIQISFLFWFSGIKAIIQCWASLFNQTFRKEFYFSEQEKTLQVPHKYMIGQDHYKSRKHCKTV